MSEETSTAAKTITVFGLEEPKELALFFRRDDARYQRRPIPADELQRRFTEFADSMREVLGGLPGTVAGYGVEEVTLTAEVSAKGSVNLLGTGGEVAGRGGITLKFTRRGDIPAGQ